MKSPAQLHFERVSAELAAAKVDPGDTMRGASAYELQLMKLRSDQMRLKSVQSVERKVEVKRELLPDYAAYVDGVLAGGRGAQDDVLVTIMVWRIDTGDYHGALAIARYALQHKLSVSDQFSRTLGTIVAEDFAEAALAAFKLEGGSFDADVLLQVAELTDAEDMPDQVRAKLFRAMGHAIEPTSPAEALKCLERAVALHDKVGAKTDIARLQKQLGESQQQDPAGSS